MATLSQQPYFLRALYEWCVNAGYTPYLVLRADTQLRIPPGYARNGEITLNVHPEAVQGLEISDDWIEFTARFGGVAHRVEGPIENVQAIYARETGEGMSFSAMIEAAVADSEADGAEEAIGTASNAVAPGGDDPESPPPKGRPSLRVVK